jgi:ComF family protein
VIQKRHFDAARAFVRYVEPAARVIKAHKFEGYYRLGPLLLRYMLETGGLPPAIRSAGVVLPVPLHPRRRRERGYDQAMLLARVVARHLGAGLLGRALVRTRYTAQQSLLSVRKRWDNVRGAFKVSVPQRVRGLRLLLVDDVMTTGATFDECARALKGAGAEAVYALALARTAP